MKKLLWLLLVPVALPAHAADPFCDTGKPSPIETALAQQLQTANSTLDMRTAQGTAYAAWDKELNRVYGDLLKAVPESNREQLRKTQRAWLAFQKEENAWLSSPAMYGDAGTSGPLRVSDAARASLSLRVCELMRFRKALNGEGT